MLNINRTASIIIPTFNRAELLPRAIESALNQSYPCEVIVCDHGSVDNTPEVANKYKGQIIYIRKEKDSGPIACWKDGLENATGEVAVINYDDDWLAPTFMEKSIHFLEEDIGFVYCRVMIHHNKNTKIIKNLEAF